MAAPLPSIFEALIIQESDTLCVALKKLNKFSVELYKFMKWYHSAVDSGELSDAYKFMICNIECPDPLTDGNTSANPPT